MFHNDIAKLPTRFREGALHGPYLFITRHRPVQEPQPAHAIGQRQ